MAAPLFSMEPEQSGLGQLPGSNPPGIGMGPSRPGIGMGGLGMSGEDTAQLQSMPDGAKIGLVLREMGAGLQGRDSPLAKDMATQQQLKLRKMMEFKAESDIVDDSIKRLKMLTGDARAQYATAEEARLKTINPGIASTFASMAKQPDITATLGDLMEIPEVQSVLKIGGPDAVRALVSKNEFWEKTVLPFQDKKRFGPTRIKIEGLIRQFALEDPNAFETIKKDGITEAEVLEMNKRLAGRTDEFSKLALDDNDLAYLSRNAHLVYPTLNIRTAKDQAAIDAEIAKRPPDKGTTFMQESRRLAELVAAGQGETKEAKDLRAKIGGETNKPPATRTVTRDTSKGTLSVQQSYVDGKWVDEETGAKFKPRDSSDDKPPSGYERDPDRPGTLRYIKGGPADPASDKDKPYQDLDKARAQYNVMYPIMMFGERTGKRPEAAPDFEKFYKEEWPKIKALAGIGGEPRRPAAPAAAAPKPAAAAPKLYQGKKAPAEYPDAKWNEARKAWIVTKNGKSFAVAE